MSYLMFVGNFYRAASMQGAVLVTSEMSVRPSICQTHGLSQNGRKICPDIYTVRKII